MSIPIDSYIDLVEPAEPDRVYYQHRNTGERAYVVTLGGKKKLRLDRPDQVIIKAFDEHIWATDERKYNILPLTRAKVAFVADAELCRVLGLPELAKRDWLIMKPQERMDWMTNGPKPVGDSGRDRARHQLWKAIMGVMERLK